MNIEKYQARNKTKYRFFAYLGVDDLTGREIRVRRSGFDTKKEAEIAYLRLLHESDYLKTNRIRFETVYDEWLEQYKLTVKSSTLNKTKEYFKNHILPSIGDYFIDAIKLKHVQKAVNDWSEKVVKFREISGYASKVFEHSKRTGKIKDNPFDLVVYPIGKKSEKNDDNYYNKHELKKFLQLAEQDMSKLWYTYFRLLAFTGMRKSEALALTWKDIDFKQSFVSITKTLTVGDGNIVSVGEPKTGASKRLIHLDKRTMDDLRSWRMEQNHLMSNLGFKTLNREQLVFSTLSNKHFPLSNPNHRLDSLIKKHNLKKISVHGFRHTHCSMMFEAGATIPEVQKRLGHTDIKVTMNIYNHVSQYKQEEAVDKLSNYLAF